MTAHKQKQSVPCAVLLVALALSAALSPPSNRAFGQAAERDSVVIARQRAYQKRARRLLQGLLQGVLRTHLKQLQENQLTDLALYGDLKDMQTRTADLIKQDMTDAVNLLSQAYSARGAERTRIYKSAHQKMHQILLRILTERERLRLRRQLSELVERVRLLISRQKAIHKDTLALNDENERGIATAIQSQKALKVLCVRLDKVLQAASEQLGDLGALASDAERALQQAGVVDATTRAVEQLTAADFAEAAKTQGVIIAGLQKVMAALQLSARSALMQAKRQVTELLVRQEKLRNTVRAQQFSDANVDKWVTEQGQIGEEMSELIMLVGMDEQCTQLTDIAIDASEAARKAIFGQEKPRALNQQGRVVGALAQLLEELNRQIGLERDRTAEEFMTLHQKLLEIRDKLAAVLAKHDTGAKAAAADKAKASKIEGEVRKALRVIANDRELTRVVASRIRTAGDAAESAGQALAAKSADSGRKVDLSGRAIRHAIGEAREGSAKAYLDALAVTLGELNRASEVMDRAASASRYLGRELQNGTFTSEQMDYPRSEMERVRQTAEKTADGVKVTAPDAVGPLKTAAPQTAKLIVGLGKGDRDAKMTEQIAVKLEDVAGKLRKTMDKTAVKLIEAVRKELEQTISLQGDLQKLLGGSRQATVPQIRLLADKTFGNTPSVGAALHRVADLHPDGERDVQRSRILAEIKREDLEKLLREAQRLAQLAKAQQGTVAAIYLAARERTGLAEAMANHADSMSDVGQGVQDLTGGGEVANLPIRETTEIASTLGQGKSEGEGMPGGGTPMGSGMVPSSPMGTAEMIAAAAGATAEEIADAVEEAMGWDMMGGGMGGGMGEGMGGGMGEGMGGGMGEGMGGGMGEGVGMGMGEGAGQGDAGGSSTGYRPFTENMERLMGNGEYRDIREGESVGAGDAGDTELKTARSGDRRAWFTSLPEAVRQAVKSRSKTVMPKGYEEVLRRYFEDQE